MAFLEWKEELNTGISVIDGQHQRIVLYINQLHEIKQTKDNGEVTEILVALIDYTLSHFTFEETLFSDAGYVNTTQHINQHEEFRNYIYKLKDRAAQGENVSSLLLNFLHEWLFEHILHEDGQYVPVVKEYLAAVEQNNGDNWLKTKVNKLFR